MAHRLHLVSLPATATASCRSIAETGRIFGIWNAWRAPLAKVRPLYQKAIQKARKEKRRFSTAFAEKREETTKNDSAHL